MKKIPISAVINVLVVILAVFYAVMAAMVWMTPSEASTFAKIAATFTLGLPVCMSFLIWAQNQAAKADADYIRSLELTSNDEEED